MHDFLLIVLICILVIWNIEQAGKIKQLNSYKRKYEKLVKRIKEYIE
jgi:phage-related holin